MKALTVCQPFASLIVGMTPDAPGPKWIENRPWSTPHRGPLLIHAGKSRTWIRSAYSDPGLLALNVLPEPESLVFGAIVGVAIVTDVVPYGPRVADDPFASGPWCWLLGARTAFRRPIPYRGQLGMFDIPDQVVEVALPRAYRSDTPTPTQGVQP